MIIAFNRLLLLLLVFWCRYTYSIPRVGGAGYAIEFDRTRSDVLGLVWNDIPQDSLTMEYWLKFTDIYAREAAVLGYSGWDSTVNPPYGSINEVQPLLKVNQISWWLRDTESYCDSSSCATFSTSWFHLAITWNRTAGHSIIYINGAPVWNQTSSLSAFTSPIVPGGCFILAQEPDSVCGEYDPMQTFNGIMDEIRIWSVIRSDQQILDNYRTPIDPMSNGLALYWNFDNDIPSVIPSSYNGVNVNAPSSLNQIVSYTVDQSGHYGTPSSILANGIFGRMPTFDPTMTWNNGRPAGLPTRPRYVISSAPLIGQRQPIIIAVAPNRSVNISLWAFDDITSILVTSIVSLPSSSGGILYQSDGMTSITIAPTIVTHSGAQTKTVIFTASSSFTGTSFIYSVNDGIGHIINATVILVLPSIDTPISQSYTTSENVGVYLILGGVTSQGTMAQTIITSLPLGGNIYQVSFACGTSAPSYSCISTNTTNLIEITSVGTPLTIDRGLVYYVPYNGASRLNDVYDWFTWAHRDIDHNITSSSANATIYVAPVNNPPVCYSQSVSLSPTATTISGSTSTSSGSSTSTSDTISALITLTAIDIDRNDNWYAKHRSSPFIRITQWPKMGKLYQVNDDGSKGDEIVNTGLLPEVRSWAKQVLNFSSQWDSCDDHCYYPGPCPNSCHQTAWQATQALGAPNCWPVYGDNDLSWTSLTPNAPNGEFLEFAFEFPVYPTGISIYENYNAQTVDQVNITSDGIGSNKQWTSLYDNTPTSVPSNLAWIFEPSLCPSTIKAAAVRIHLDTNIYAGKWQNIDAVELTGTLDYPTGLVSNTLGRIIYEPINGAHSANDSIFDTLQFSATDCIAPSLSDGIIQFNIQQPNISNIDISSLGVSLTTTLSPKPSVSSSITVDKSPLQISLATALSLSLSSYQTNIVVVSAAIVAVSDNLNDASTTVIYQQNSDATPGDIIPLSSLGATAYITNDNFSFMIHTSVLTKSQLYVWYNLRGINDSNIYVYRVAVVLAMDCSGVDNYFARPITLDCVPCSSINDLDRSKMTETELFNYKKTCRIVETATFALRIALLLVTAVFVAIAGTLTMLVVRYRDTNTIRSSSFEFCMLIFLGSFLTYASIYAIFIPSNVGQDRASCIAQLWFPHMGFAVVFGSLFLKTYRLSRIFNPNKLTHVVLPNRHLFGFLAVILSLVILWLALWSFIGKPQPTVYISADGLSQFTICHTQDSFWSLAILLADGFALLYGVLLCYQVRNTPSQFNESKWIAYALYNTAFSGIIVAGIVYGLPEDATTQAVLISIGLLWCTSATLAVLFIPKLFNILLGGEGIPNHTYVAESQLRTGPLNGTQIGNASTPNGAWSGAGGHSLQPSRYMMGGGMKSIESSSPRPGGGLQVRVKSPANGPMMTIESRGGSPEHRSSAGHMIGNGNGTGHMLDVPAHNLSPVHQLTIGATNDGDTLTDNHNSPGRTSPLPMSPPTNAVTSPMNHNPNNAIASMNVNSSNTLPPNGVNNNSNTNNADTGGNGGNGNGNNTITFHAPPNNNNGARNSIGASRFASGIQGSMLSEIHA